MSGHLFGEESKLIENNKILSDMVWTSSARRLALLTLHSFKFNEPVLLVGETGCGKTRVCQTIAHILKRQLISVNCHLNTESSDFLGKFLIRLKFPVLIQNQELPWCSQRGISKKQLNKARDPLET